MSKLEKIKEELIFHSKFEYCMGYIMALMEYGVITLKEYEELEEYINRIF